MTDETTAQRIETAERLTRIEGALSSMSFDLLEIKSTVKEASARLSGGLSGLLEWRAAHEAESAVRHAVSRDIPAKVSMVESQVKLIEDRQLTHRTILLTTVGGTLVALAKALWEWVAK